MPFQIVRNDIVRMEVDAIVNAANERLAQGGGVCGAIFAAAGPQDLQAACDEIGYCPTGSAVMTPGFALPARHVIHAVGPIWRGGNYGEEMLLRSCYASALDLAVRAGDNSIAFPLISSGIYGYPKDQAIRVALREIKAFLNTHEMDVYLILFDAEALLAGRGRFANIAQYIDDQYVESSPYRRRSSMLNYPLEGMSYGSSAPKSLDDMYAQPSAPSAPMPTSAPKRLGSFSQRAMPDSMPSATPARRAPKGTRKGFLKRLLAHMDAGFSDTLMRMIDERGLKDSEVYKRANMSRQHFSKIRSNPQYQPKKQTVLALAIALELSLDDTRLLLERAGFALTHADERDVIVEYFISQGSYDIYEINLALYGFDQPLLG